jgi:hypothetical protein
MFSLSFLNTGLLILAVATVLPLIIWLLAKKKPPQIIFSTIRFIKSTEKEQKNRAQLKNILLLIIRMLIILLIVLAAARPSMQIPNLKPSKQHPPTAIAILLDTSFSMDYTEGSKSTLEKAKTAIREINKRANPQDMMILITSDASWNSMNSQIQAGKLPDNLINSVKTTWEPMTVTEMLTYADNKLQESQMTNREAYLLSDGQTQVLPAKLDFPVMLIPLPKPLPWNNLSVQNARPVMQLTNKQQNQTIQFDVINHGNALRRDVLVRVDFNGIKAAEKFITLEPGQKVTESLPVQIVSSGWQSGYVEVLDEKLTADNRSWFTFPFEMHPTVGVITNRSSLPIIMQSVVSVFTTAQGSIKLVSPAQVSFQQLKDYSLLIVYDCGEPNPRLREFLQDWTNARKGLLFCADASQQAGWKAYYNQLFGVQIRDFNPNAQPLTYVNPYHSITSLIDVNQIKRTSISDFWNAQSTGAANILLSAGNSPLALAKDSSILWLFDPAATKSRFYLEAAFPVFAFRSLQYLANSRFESDVLSVGQLINADDLVMPGGDKKELNGGSLKTYEPGIYTVVLKGSSNQNLAIQPDYKESSYSPLVLPKNKNYHVLGDKWQDQLFLSRLGHDIWKYCLLAVLFLFLLEMLIVKSEEWKRVKEQS